MKPLSLVAILASSCVLALLCASPITAVNGEASDFYGIWQDYNINGDTGVWTRFTYTFYTNGSGTFAHAGNDYDMIEWFTWIVNGNGTISLVRSYGASCYPYSFNSAYNDLTITMDGDTDYTFDKIGTIGEVEEEESYIAFCGGILLPAGTVALAASVFTARRRQ